MAIEPVQAYVGALGLDGRVREFDVSSATVAPAAQAVGMQGARIAKTLSFAHDDGCMLIVGGGQRQRRQRQVPRRVPPQGAHAHRRSRAGAHAARRRRRMPFTIDPSLPAYLDVSLRRFETVFPAAGSANSAVELSMEESFTYARARDWVDVCKDWEGRA